MTKTPRIAKAAGRSVTEWIGKTPDSKCPPHVLLRIFDRGGGVCFLSGRKIMPGDKWEAHHKVALCEGGENRESNLVPVLVEPHKLETAKQRKRKAKTDSVRQKHLGCAPAPQKPIQSRGFPKSDKQPKIDKSGLPELPRRSLYQ